MDKVAESENYLKTIRIHGFLLTVMKTSNPESKNLYLL
jgi:hypothetical protein